MQPVDCKVCKIINTIQEEIPGQAGEDRLDTRQGILPGEVFLSPPHQLRYSTTGQRDSVAPLWRFSPDYPLATFCLPKSPFFPTTRGDPRSKALKRMMHKNACIFVYLSERLCTCASRGRQISCKKPLLK